MNNVIGQNNLVRQAHLMQQLGVDTSKQLDKMLLGALNEAQDDNDTQDDDAELTLPPTRDPRTQNSNPHNAQNDKLS